jgi:hypothetical protein
MEKVLSFQASRNLYQITRRHIVEGSNLYANIMFLDIFHRPKTKLNSVALVRKRTIPTERS